MATEQPIGYPGRRRPTPKVAARSQALKKSHTQKLSPNSTIFFQPCVYAADDGVGDKTYSPLVLDIASIPQPTLDDYREIYRIVHGASLGLSSIITYSTTLFDSKTHCDLPARPTSSSSSKAPDT